MARSANKRIGILGGTFNPVHNGHLHIAKQALKKLHLNKVIFVPTYIPPHKKIRGDATASDRLKMLRLAIGNKKRFALLLYEMRKKGKSYSIKTATHLKKRYGHKAELFFIIGADSLKGLKGWRDVAHLCKLIQFVVVPRPGFHMKSLNFSNVLKLGMPKKDISSTKIRRLIKNRRPIKRFVPKEVLKYIKKKKLYTI